MQAISTPDHNREGSFPSASMHNSHQPTLVWNILAPMHGELISKCISCRKLKETFQRKGKAMTKHELGFNTGDWHFYHFDILPKKLLIIPELRGEPQYHFIFSFFCFCAWIIGLFLHHTLPKHAVKGKKNTC